MDMEKPYQTVVCAVLIFAAGMYTAEHIDVFNPNEVPASPATVVLRTPETVNPVYTDYELPETLILCEEPVPLQDRRVWEMLDREFNITVWDRAQVYMYLKRAGRYFPYIEKKLAQADLPDDLKYLAVAESALLAHSRSTKGAKGPWQFMTPAARSNGLRRDSVVDERLNFRTSTEAAIKNLKRLRTKFGSWALAMAAYNGGETRLRKAIREQRTENYYRLNLPLETERYVFRIAAIKIIMENPQRFGYNLSTQGRYRPRPHDVLDVNARQRVAIVDFAEAIGSDYKQIKELNPHFLRTYMPTGNFGLHVPAARGIPAAAYFKRDHPGTVSAALIVSERTLAAPRH